MSGQPIGRALAILGSAALLASLTTLAIGGPAVAVPKCGGKAATIVGTAKGEVIRGTAKADVIVARGGHDVILGGGGRDIICGNGGNDRLVGGPGNDLILGRTGRDRLVGSAGRDWLAGGPGDDTLDGGPGDDACFQGSGSGPRVACERPPAPAPVPPPPAAPAPGPEPKLLAIAWSDLDADPGYSAGDVLIAKVIDTNGDGKASEGDSITMGRHPTTRTPTSLAHFKDWKVTSHIVTRILVSDADELRVESGPGEEHRWNLSPGFGEGYQERLGGAVSLVADSHQAPGRDSVLMHPDTPSKPDLLPEDTDISSTDDPFVEVELHL